MTDNIPTPENIDRHVGRQLYRLRLLRGLSQESLGRALGLSFQQVQKYERGTNRIAASRLYHIAAILRVPPSLFFDGLPAAPEHPLPVCDRLSVEMLLHYEILPRALRLSLLETIRALATAAK